MHHTRSRSGADFKLGSILNPLSSPVTAPLSQQQQLGTSRPVSPLARPLGNDTVLAAPHRPLPHAYSDPQISSERTRETAAPDASGPFSFTTRSVSNTSVQSGPDDGYHQSHYPSPALGFYSRVGANSWARPPLPDSPDALRKTSCPTTVFSSSIWRPQLLGPVEDAASREVESSKAQSPVTDPEPQFARGGAEVQDKIGLGIDMNGGVLQSLRRRDSDPALLPTLPSLHPVTLYSEPYSAHSTIHLHPIENDDYTPPWSAPLPQHYDSGPKAPHSFYAAAQLQESNAQAQRYIQTRGYPAADLLYRPATLSTTPNHSPPLQPFDLNIHRDDTLPVPNYLNHRSNSPTPVGYSYLSDPSSPAKEMDPTHLDPRWAYPVTTPDTATLSSLSPPLSPAYHEPSVTLPTTTSTMVRRLRGRPAKPLPSPSFPPGVDPRQLIDDPSAYLRSEIQLRSIPVQPALPTVLHPKTFHGVYRFIFETGQEREYLDEERGARRVAKLEARIEHPGRRGSKGGKRSAATRPSRAKSAKGKQASKKRSRYSDSEDDDC